MWDIPSALYWKTRVILISTDMLLLIARSLQQNEIEQYTFGSEIFPLAIVVASVVYWIVTELFQLTSRNANREEQRFADNELPGEAPLGNQ